MGKTFRHSKRSTSSRLTWLCLKCGKKFDDRKLVYNENRKPICPHCLSTRIELLEEE